MVMILEDRGVTKEMFLSLLNAAVADIRLACDDLGELIRVLRAHKLGHHFGLISALQRLADAPFRLHLNPATPDRCLRSPFIDDLIRCAVGTILRELQYKCRIPVPDSWHLVGVADEGPSYIKRGICEEKELYTLKEGDIYGEPSLHVYALASNESVQSASRRISPVSLNISRGCAISLAVQCTTLAMVIVFPSPSPLLPPHCSQ